MHGQTKIKYYFVFSKTAINSHGLHEHHSMIGPCNGKCEGT